MKEKSTGKVIPPLQTGGKGFDEVLKQISQADPNTVRQQEKKSGQGKP